MTPRSFLFVPGDSPRKMAKAEASVAQALILDLEDAVAAEKLDEARQIVVDYLKSRPDRSKQRLWVRVNPIDTDKALGDVAAIVAGAPCGVLLPKCESAADIVKLDHFLTILERREGVAPGSIKIMPVATETAAAMFGLGGYRGVSPRLYGLTWGAEDLAASVGALTNKGEDDKAYGLTFQIAKSFCLLGAKAAGVHAVDTIQANFRDGDALVAEVRRSKLEGFSAKIAIHPDQLAAINAGFMPDDKEIAHARAVIAAFGAGIGAAQLNGMMLDKPHLTQAQQTLQAAGLPE